MNATIATIADQSPRHRACFDAMRYDWDLQDDAVLGARIDGCLDAYAEDFALSRRAVNLILCAVLAHNE